MNSYLSFLPHPISQVFWASNVAQMDANIFQDPAKFDPTRYERSSSIPLYCFVAFGGGSRICPGNEFARIEILVVMLYIITEYRWKLCCKEDTFNRDPLPSPLNGLPIELEVRNSHGTDRLSASGKDLVIDT